VVPAVSRCHCFAARPAAQMFGGNDSLCSAEEPISAGIADSHRNDQQCSRQNRRARDRNVEKPAAHAHYEGNDQTHEEFHVGWLSGCSARRVSDECQQFSVHLVLQRRTHAVGRTGVDLQDGALDDSG